MDIGQQCLHILTDIPKLLSGLIDKGTLTAASIPRLFALAYCCSVIRNPP